MSVEDIGNAIQNLTSVSDIEALTALASERHRDLQIAQVGLVRERRQLLASTIGSLEDLIGEDTQPPYDPEAWQLEEEKPVDQRNYALRPTLISVGKHPPQVLAEFTGLVHHLQLQGVLTLARNALTTALIARDS